VSLAGPPPVPANPLLRLALDLKAERAVSIPFPPGDTRFSPSRTSRFLRDPLPLLLDGYARFGPVFTMRVFHHNVVWVLGPEANHHVLVANADNFSWREGHMSDLLPLLGRRPAHRGRGVPPGLAAGHAPRLPPRADRRLPCAHGGRDGARAGVVAARQPRGPLRVDPPGRAADRDARPLRPQRRRGPPGGAGLRGGPVVLGDGLRPPGPARPGDAVAADGRRPPAPGRPGVRRAGPPGGRGRAPGRPARPPARRHGRGRALACRAGRSATTS
jgi:hypothetical protein